MKRVGTTGRGPWMIRLGVRPRTLTPLEAERWRLERVLARYLRDCYVRKTTVRASELAQLLELSPPYVSEVYRKAFGGKGLARLLKERQVEYAAFLLETTPLTTDEIAAAAGFGTPSTFFRVFAAIRGVTPRAFSRRAP